MSELKCPFCNEPLVEALVLINDLEIYKCPKCVKSACKSVWQELITTRKALDVAVDALDNIKKNCMTMIETESVCRYALEQINEITKGEQKWTK